MLSAAEEDAFCLRVHACLFVRCVCFVKAMLNFFGVGVFFGGGGYSPQESFDDQCATDIFYYFYGPVDYVVIAMRILH